MSLGRVDGFLDIYIERDLQAGRLTESEAQELIDQVLMTSSQMPAAAWQLGCLELPQLPNNCLAVDPWPAGTADPFRGMLFAAGWQKSTAEWHSN